jgi:hypothetical protein
LLGERGERRRRSCERELAPVAVAPVYGLATRFPRRVAVGLWERGERAALARIALPNARIEARSRGLSFFAITFMRL